MAFIKQFMNFVKCRIKMVKFSIYVYMASLSHICPVLVFKMANVRDSDTSLWLHNKLGTSNDSWTSGSICSQLNKEVLRNIKDCFPDLQTQVKLKLLLSFFHIPRRHVEEVMFFGVIFFTFMFYIVYSLY